MGVRFSKQDGVADADLYVFWEICIGEIIKRLMDHPVLEHFYSDQQKNSNN